MLHYSLNSDDWNVFVIPVGASAVAADGCKSLFQICLASVCMCQQYFNTAVLTVFNEVKSYEYFFTARSAAAV